MGAVAEQAGADSKRRSHHGNLFWRVPIFDPANGIAGAELLDGFDSELSEAGGDGSCDRGALVWRAGGDAEEERACESTLGNCPRRLLAVGSGSIQAVAIADFTFAIGGQFLAVFVHTRGFTQAPKIVELFDQVAEIFKSGGFYQVGFGA